MEKKSKLGKKKGKQFWKKKEKKRKKERESWKKIKKYKKRKKREKALWITVVIHSDLGVGEQ
jgi:3-hydroxyacyl-CoA dehydrogenase